MLAEVFLSINKGVVKKWVYDGYWCYSIFAYSW